MKTPTELSQSEPAPSPRLSAAGGIFDEKMYVFCGKGRKENHFSDIWELSIENETWTQLSKNELPRLRLPGISRINGDFYIFGGRNATNSFFNDLWVFNGEDIQRLATDGPVPESRYGHGQVAVGNSLYLFGGYRFENGQHELFNDLWRYNTESNRWTLLCQGGPTPRYGVSMGYWGNKLFVFGGRYLSKELREDDETWLFDLTDRQWTRVDSDTSPAPRYTAGSTITEDALYVYGGITKKYTPFDTPAIRRVRRFCKQLPVRQSLFPRFKKNQYYSDLWRFDRSDQEWEKISTYPNILSSKTPIMGQYKSSLIVGFGCNADGIYSNVWNIPEIFKKY